MKSIVDKMLMNVLVEPDILVSPEEEKEFAKIDLKKEFDEEDEEPAEEHDGDLRDPVLVLLNVLSIVATKEYPYEGYVEAEDADQVRKDWGGTDRPNPYSVQKDDGDV